MGDLGTIDCIGKGTFQPIIESGRGVALANEFTVVGISHQR